MEGGEQEAGAGGGTDRLSSSELSEQLLVACVEGDLNKVKYLVEVEHVDPDTCRDEQHHMTLLHLASTCGHLDIVRYLVEERNCDVECRNKYEDIPLHCAALRARLDVVQYLISERGCDPMCGAQYGKTPLHAASLSESGFDVVKYLIEDVKVDSSCRDENDATPLHFAALGGHLSVVKLLVEDYLCDPGVRDKNGDTPADVARRRGHTHITSYLSSIEKTVSTDLRRALVAQLKPYTRKATPTGKVLGNGTYGSVIELTSARETVAGKVFKMSSTAQMLPVAFRVCGELSTMMQLHHPNIVQCKGVSLLIDQPLPVLLMERMMSSLHAYLLHSDNSNLSVERKVSILHNTASGLEYLHSQTPAIIHRDLTAKNVLLDSKLRAKITDFGNSRIMDLDPEASPETLTSLPGTLEYMPPEAQGGSVAYDPSLDVFSFGHLSLFTVTQTPVRLLPATYLDHSTGKVHGRSEVKRREGAVEAAEQVLSENCSLVAVMKQCLHNNPAQRPNTSELVTRLQEMVTPEENSSAEYRALRQLSGTLLGAIRDPLTLAWKLYSKGLVSRDVREQACQDSRSVEQQGSCLLSALESRVASDETTFDTFLSILRDSEDPAMVEMYQKLKDARDTLESQCPPAKRHRLSRGELELHQLQVFHCGGGKEIRVISQIAGGWEKVALALRFDGATLTAIDREFHRPEMACLNMFQRWMRGEGRGPVCWEVLMKALRDAEYTVLAEDLAVALQQLEHSCFL